MDVSEFVEHVRSANERNLARLGSEKALVATTAGSLDRESVLETAAAAETRAVETFDRWVDDETDDDARSAFEAERAREQEHRERVLELADRSSVEAEPDPLHEHLRDLDETVDRVAAGLVARPLVASRSLLQVINFFVNEGDERGAALFRELRAETDEQVERGGEVVATVCESDGDRDRAVAAAGAVVDLAYDEYAASLEEMGIDPKPVC
ncbi:hypothetical protein SAMN05216559_2808 [Halomicrobium zhouii]|uniref:Rubrerythrin n=1 Tax=Halomicrobium zhouii TaxID=767519 RepID=A0A1I6LJG9_9EURY|nr:hypothetical protein [Halomicrobium zhouii]SFS03609.1 hypothetical protein SAMN05216559_2808 [Halomicrobium zhouii]